MNEDDISRMFEDITPDLFKTNTSAKRVNVNSGSDQTKDNFYVWVQSNIEATRICMDVVSEVADHLPMFSVMVNDEETRVFVAEQDETVQMMVSRLTRESQQMQPSWLYLALKSTAAIGGQTYDLSTPEGKAQLERDRTKQAVVNWYAEQLQPEHEIVFGSIQAETPEKHVYLGSDVRGASPVFKSILEYARGPV